MPDPKKSKIEITTPKIPILFMSDWGDTGFGTVGMELCARLAEMEVFDVHYLGWHSKPEDRNKAVANNITLHNTQFWDPSDQFGAKTFDAVIGLVSPKVVLTLGDPWMVDYVNLSQHRDKFNWIMYVPIDRDYISRSWRQVMRKPDVLVLYSKFGYDVVKEQIPLAHPEMILHGVDRMSFKPWYPEGTDENTPVDELMRVRKNHFLGDKFADKWVVGFLGRNQMRKAIPRAFKAFKAFNCETWCERSNVEVSDENGANQEYSADEFCNELQKFRCDMCPAFRQRPATVDSVIYLHTTRGDGSDPQDRPGIGWLVDELGERYQIEGRVGMTPKITALHGVPREAVAMIMNCFDVHLYLSHSEGFGLPIAESMACGTPTFVTNYSSMPELVKDGGGHAIKVKDYDTFVTWENEWANADIGDAADRINELFTDSKLYAKMRKAAAENKYVPNWNDVAMQFRDLILMASRQ